MCHATVSLIQFNRHLGEEAGSMGPKRARFPACSHLNMDRVYGFDQICYVCGKTPAMGFLYECQQDKEKRKTLQEMTSQQHCSPMLPPPPPKSALRLRLEEGGLSESIIQNAEQGGYTDSQIEVLLLQKQKVRETIAAQLKSTGAYSVDGSSSSKPLAEVSNHVPWRSRYLSKRPLPLTPPQQPCTMKACHNCRPYFKDRMPISFPDVVSGAFPPLTAQDSRRLPVKSAEIMQRVGLRENPTPIEPYSPFSYLTSTSAGQSYSVDGDADDQGYYSYIPELSRIVANNARPSGASRASSIANTTQSESSYVVRKNAKRSSMDIARYLARRTLPGVRMTLRDAVKKVLGVGRFINSDSPSGFSCTSSGDSTPTISPAQPHPHPPSKGKQREQNENLEKTPISRLQESHTTLPLRRTGLLRSPSSSSLSAPTNDLDAILASDFDIPSLRKIRRQKERVEVSHGTYTGGFEDVCMYHSDSSYTEGEGDAEGGAEGEGEDMDGVEVESDEEDEEEVEVMDGVALTEEAVGMGVADVKTDEDEECVMTQV